MSNTEWEEGRDDQDREDDRDDVDEVPADVNPDKWHYLDRSVLADGSPQEIDRYLEWQDDMVGDEESDDPQELFDWQVNDPDEEAGDVGATPPPLTQPTPSLPESAGAHQHNDDVDFYLVDFAATLDRYELPANQSGAEISCQVTIDPTLNGRWADSNTMSAGVCLLIDCSLSMYGEKFEAAISTARLIAEILHERHFLSIVAFQTHSHVIVKNVVPSEPNRESINEQIDTLRDHLGGSTNLVAGIDSAIRILEEVPTDSKIVLIISDGEPNSFPMALKQAEIANRKGIQFHAVGIGDAYNAEQLMKLVAPYNGAVYGDSEVANMDRIFRDLVDRIGKIFATNVQLEFNFHSKVKLKRVFRISPERVYYDLSKLNYQDDRLRLQLGNIEGNRYYEYLLQFEVGDYDPGLREVMSLQLQYDINNAGILVTERMGLNLEIDFTEEQAEAPGDSGQISDALRSASVLQSSNELLEALDARDQERTLAALDSLKQHSYDEGNLDLHCKLEEIQQKVQDGARLDEKARNDLLLAASVANDARDKRMVHKPAPVVEGSDTEVEEIETDVVELTPVAEAAEAFVEPPEPVVEEPEPLPAEAPPIEREAAPERSDGIDPSLYQVFDLVLIDVGADPIRFMRETRHATRMGLRQIADVMRNNNALIYTFDDLATAEALQERLTGIGARTEVYGRHDGRPR